MAKIDKTVAEIEAVLPAEPAIFRKWAKDRLPIVPIYYHRNRKDAECRCGMCGAEYTTTDIPVRNEMGRCTVCGHIGIYEWKKVTRTNFVCEKVILIQCTTDNNLVVRNYCIQQEWASYKKATIRMEEAARYFLTLGQAYRMDYVYHWYPQKRETWEMTSFERPVEGAIFPGFRTQIENSNFKYCDIDAIVQCVRYGSTNNGYVVANVLESFANNPAIEMYCNGGDYIDYLEEEMRKKNITENEAKEIIKEQEEETKKKLTPGLGFKENNLNSLIFMRKK